VIVYYLHESSQKSQENTLKHKETGNNEKKICSD